MKKISTFAVACFAICLSVNASPLWLEGKSQSELKVNQGMQGLSPQAYYNVSKAFGPSVVNISTVSVSKTVQTPFGFGIQPNEHGNSDHPFAPFFGEEFFERFFGGSNMPRQRKQSSLGSGFVLNHQGYIVTNNHVVANADEIKVIFVDETEVSAKLIGRDSKTDVALLKLTQSKKVHPVILGSSQATNPGDVVVAIGNPFGLSHSVTQGIVSAKERSIGLGPYDNFIQTDASINPGNSGGPLMNIYGEVIGINTAIHASGQGIGFAIPIDLAKSVLMRLKKDGYVVRGYLGVSVAEIKDQHVKALKLPNKKGALVVEVLPDTPAAKSKIEPGDVIVAFDNTQITSSDDLPLVVANADIGARAKVTLIRNGMTKKVSVRIDELEDTQTSGIKEPKVDQSADALGLTVQSLDKKAQSMLKLDPKQKGVVITRVQTDSTSHKKGLQPGDVITQINRVPIDHVKTYQKVASKIKKGDTVLLRFIRHRRELFVAFTLE